MKNKKILGMPIALFIVSLLVVGLASAMLISYIGSIQTSVNIEQGITLDGNDWDDPVSESHSGFSVLPYVGINDHELISVVNEDVVLHLNKTCSSDGGDCNDLTHSLVKIYDAGVQDYDVPTCDVTVTSGNSITTAINGAVDNDVVCVEAGNYDGFRVAKPVHVVAVGNVIIDGTIAYTSGQQSMIEVSSDSVTIEGFTIDSGTGLRTIITDMNTNNLNIKNNVFVGADRGVFFNNGINNVLENNLFNVREYAISADGQTNFLVQNNEFEENITTELMGLGPGAEVLFTNNNIYTDAPLYDWGAANFNATYNYFDSGIHTVGSVIATYQDMTQNFTVPANSIVEFASIVEMPAGMNPDYTYNLLTQVELS